MTTPMARKKAARTWKKSRASYIPAAILLSRTADLRYPAVT
jgi:hypothetical protein